MASPKASSPNSHRIGTTTPKAKTTLDRCCTPSFLNSSPLRQGGRTFNPSGSPIRYVSGEPDFLSRADHFLNPYKFGDIWAALFAGATSSLLECVSVVERSLLPSTHALLLRAGDSEAFERSEKALFANDAYRRDKPAQSKLARTLMSTGVPKLLINLRVRVLSHGPTTRQRTHRMHCSHMHMHMRMHKRMHMHMHMHTCRCTRTNHLQMQMQPAISNAGGWRVHCKEGGNQGVLSVELRKSVSLALWDRLICQQVDLPR